MMDVQLKGACCAKRETKGMNVVVYLVVYKRDGINKPPFQDDGYGSIQSATLSS